MNKKEFKLKWPNKIINTVSGYSIERTDRTTLRYKNDIDLYSIEVEPGDGLAVYKDTVLKVLPSGQTEKVTEEEKSKILLNVVAAFEFWKEKIIVL